MARFSGFEPKYRAHTLRQSTDVTEGIATRNSYCTGLSYESRNREALEPPHCMRYRVKYSVEMASATGPKLQDLRSIARRTKALTSLCAAELQPRRLRL